MDNTKDIGLRVSDPLTRVLSTADISDEVLGFDVPGHQLVVGIGGFCKRQPLEHIGQPAVGLHATGLGGLNERVKQCTGLGASGRIGKEPCFSADHKRADRVFHRIVMCALPRCI